MELQFSIHQELWQAAWIAATSAVKARKRQTDLNVQQRVEQLLVQHGPKTSRPLTLRVYGTMIKGFCVINNDRARSLHADCERVVLLFAERPYVEGLQMPKLPAAKRQRVDAFTLDLDLTKVQDAEAFDWTQAPLGDSMLLSLDASQLPSPDPKSAAIRPVLREDMMQAPSLLEEGGLLDEVFPSVDAPIVMAHGALPLPEGPEGAPEVPRAPPALEALRADAEGPAGLGPISLPGLDLGPASEIPPELGSAVEVHQERKKKRRRLRFQPMPGHVFGFDVDTQMRDLGREVGLAAAPSLASCALELSERFPNRLGQLEALAGLAGLAGFHPGSVPRSPLPFTPQHDGPALSDADHAELPELPEIQPLLGNVGDQLRPDMLGAVFASPPQAPAFMAAAAEAADAAAEAMGEEGDSVDPKDGSHDVQTAQVGLVMRRYLSEQGNSFLDDIMQPSTTSRSTAARAFSSLLALATGGGLLLQQEEPYGPIYISLC